MKRIRKRYPCIKCKRNHNTSSKICRKHREYLVTPEGSRIEIEEN